MSRRRTGQTADAIGARSSLLDPRALARPGRQILGNRTSTLPLRTCQWNNHVLYPRGHGNPGHASGGNTGRDNARRRGAAMVTGRLSGEELDRLLEHTSALMDRPWLLPAELHIKLDTFRADLRAEQEDRAARQH